MAEEVSFVTQGSVNPMCFTFSNPLSINGPFGNFELWITDSNVRGVMTLRLLFGLGATANLVLTGAVSGTNPIVCTLQGNGVVTRPGQPPSSVQVGMTVTFVPDWSTGTLVFSEGVIGVAGGLPVQKVDCATLTAKG